MRLGFAVPQFGPDARPEALLEVARKAEDLGYDSLWVAERLLYPLNPKALTRGPPMVRCRLRIGARSIPWRPSRTSRQ
jgi:alkanesulfonate monooxygenase SsuD/methylene tetrahydromethanopterin reductase-like flavin-dependent oxidoreductase (luciferase family)